MINDNCKLSSNYCELKLKHDTTYRNIKTLCMNKHLKCTVIVIGQELAMHQKEKKKRLKKFFTDH